MIDEFREHLPFDLDPFQTAACEALAKGRSVLVAAPTGAGKTVVAEFAVYQAMNTHQTKVFYTAPMKALSNQKYQEFVASYGADNVGLLTGDTNINSQARIVVMTTEVLRNMLYANSDLLSGLGYVIMDEVHYLADRFRGAVWEEVIIHLPQAVKLVSLSATVSNAEEFGDWLHTVRGDTAVIVSEERPVPLEQHILIRTKLIDLFDTSTDSARAGDAADAHRVNPELVQMARYAGRARGATQMKNVGHHRSRQGRQHQQHTNRSAIIRLLDDRNLTPAIFFIFSRAGCDAAVNQVMRSDIRLTTTHQRAEIRSFVEERCRTIPGEDLAVLGYWNWLDALQRGIAAHHAGMLPAFKEVVEELFRRKLLRIVFATETLALGINMPARTVVLERLEKFNGEARVAITPGEYTQLTGRAGRRGIDDQGHSVIQWRDGLDPEAVASLASRRTYPLNSSFTPSYNMAVNLIAQFGRERTRDILETSFAQFQADRDVVDLARKVRAQEESLAGYEKEMTCHLGDFQEYSGIRREISDLERKGAGRAGATRRNERDRRQQRLSELRAQQRHHPCHDCKDREAHARWAQRWWKLSRTTKDARRQITSRTGAIAGVFDRVTDVLRELGYLKEVEGDLEVQPTGQTLRRIYGERDLLVAECLRAGVWKELDPPQLAAMAAAIIHEPRKGEGQYGERHGLGGTFHHALQRTTALWNTLDTLETEHRLTGSEPPSTALSLPMSRWARGENLERVLDEADLAAGDFVRITKQTIDLLDQLTAAAQPDISHTAHAAVEHIRRGIVAHSSVT